MRGNSIIRTLAVAFVGAFLMACQDGATSPVPRERQAASSSVALNQVLPAPFAIRAPLDAFFINQPSEMMIRSTELRDFAMQRLVTAPGAGGWHTHDGPSFGIVEQGQVMITRYTKDGCVSTTYGPGEAYFEVAGEVHRATVLGTATAVEYKARFFVTIGGSFGTPAADPGCTQ